jgi:hypothetical protein
MPKLHFSTAKIGDKWRQCRHGFSGRTSSDVGAIPTLIDQTPSGVAEISRGASPPQADDTPGWRSSMPSTPAGSQSRQAFVVHGRLQLQCRNWEIGRRSDRSGTPSGVLSVSLHSIRGWSLRDNPRLIAGTPVRGAIWSLDVRPKDEMESSRWEKVRLERCREPSAMTGNRPTISATTKRREFGRGTPGPAINQNSLRPQPKIKTGEVHERHGEPT